MNIKNKYDIIYADPPWTYQRKGGPKHIGMASQTYTCMSDTEIYNLGIDKITKENSILFLWCTWPKIDIGLETIKRWGFKYKTVGFVWIKTNKIKTDSLFWGLGHYTRGNSEFCLIGVKGKSNILNHGVHQIVMSGREEHSKKPAEVRRRIVQLCGDKSRIELFARQKTEGWDVCGDEV